MNLKEGIDQFIYKTPRLNYTDEQAAFLGLGDDWLDKDASVPGGTKFGGGIKNILLSFWLNDFNPIEKAPVLSEENPTAMFVTPPLFKPMTELNRRKVITKDAVLRYITALTLAGDTIASFSVDKKLTNEGIKGKSQEVAAAFIDEYLTNILMVEFKKNKEVLDKALSDLVTPPEEPKTPQEVLIDIEIRSIFRENEDLRKDAFYGNLSARHDLAIARGEAVISGFDQNRFDRVFFAGAIRRNIKAAYQVDVLFSINCYLWFICHRSITGLLDFAQFTQSEKDTVLNELGLNWRGENLMSRYSKAHYVITKAARD